MKRSLMLGLICATFLASCGEKTNTITNPIAGGTWEIAIGTSTDERAFDAAATSDGGFILAGQRGLHANSDNLLVKVDAAGGTIWEKRFGGADEDVLYGVAVAPNGAIFAAGKFKRTIDLDTSAYLVCTDDTGHVIWDHRIGGNGEDEGRDVIALPDNGCVMVGTIENKFFGSYNMYATRYNFDGSMAWEQEYGGNAVEFGLCCASTMDGGFMFGGSTTAYGDDTHKAFVVKASASGAYQWEWALDSAFTSVVTSVVATSDGGYLVGGYIVRDHPDHDALLIKLDAARNLVWMQEVGQTGPDIEDDYYAVVEVSPLEYAAVGRTSSFGAQIEDAILTRFSANGSPIGTTLYGEHSFESAHAVDVLPGGGFLIAGETRSIGAGGMDIFLIRTDREGGI